MPLAPYINPPPPAPQASATSISTWSPADPALTASLAAAPWKVVDTETTGLTPYSPQVSLGIIQKALRAAGFPGKKRDAEALDRSLRCRVLTAAWPDNFACWDLESLTPEERRAVAGAAIQGTFVAHNAGFDLAWLRHVAGPEAPWPEEVVDTMLLARLVKPQAPLELLRLASSGNVVAEKLAGGLMADKPAGGWSLDSLIYLLFRVKLNKALQGPANWALPSPLPPKHFDYATGDVAWTLRLWLTLIDATDDDPLAAWEAWKAWKAAHPVWDAVALGQQVRDAAAVRETGLPFSVQAAETFAAAQKVKVQDAVKALAAAAPELATFADELIAGAGLNNARREALAAAFAARGVEIGQTASGKVAVGKKDLKLAGAKKGESAELYAALEAVDKARKRGDMALQMASFVAPNGRIHALLAHGPATGRLSCSEPNLQNPPRDADFRAIVQAPPGHRIIAADFGAQEMRVAAALAIRAQREMTISSDADIVAVRQGRRVYRDAAQEARSQASQLRVAKAWDSAERAENKATKLEMLYCYGLALSNGNGHEWSALRDTLASGRDVHLATAMRLLGRDPDAEITGPGREKALKAELAKERQTAKSSNFGLLYGQDAPGFRDFALTSYGVEMALEEAAKLREAWFALYPEIRLWQLWTASQPISRQWLLSKKPWDEAPKRRPVSVYRVTTLAGRKFIVWKVTQALNYQDQGSGADMTMLAIQLLWDTAPEAARHLVAQVHDELILCSPEGQAEEHAAALTEAMAWAGERILAPFGVPVGMVDVTRNKDGSLPDHWLGK